VRRAEASVMKWSFLPPFAGLKRTRSQAGLLAYGIADCLIADCGLRIDVYAA
jgi:hypothetical protein